MTTTSDTPASLIERVRAKGIEVDDAPSSATDIITAEFPAEVIPEPDYSSYPPNDINRILEPLTLVDVYNHLRVKDFTIEGSNGLAAMPPS